MLTPSPDDVRAAIRRAWHASKAPPERISEPTYDDEGVTDYFRGRTWEHHAVAALRYHEVGLSFFTVEAFCYYLPAYMLAVLEDLDAADVIYDGIVHHLSPTHLGRQWADSYRARMAGFTDEQKEAIRMYLAWCRPQWDEDSSTVRRIDEIIAYLSSGEVHRPASAVERLLQLGGESGRAPAELDWLRLSNTTVSDGDLAGLAAFSALRELGLSGTQLTDAGLAHLSVPTVAAALARLEKLDLSSCTHFSAEGLRHLAALRGLAELVLANTELDDAGLRALAPLALHRLNLVHAHRLTDQGWMALDISELAELRMFGVAVPDSLLTRLGAAGTLRTLECRWVSDAGLVTLCQNQALAHLEVSEAVAIGKAGLTGLAALPALQKLSLGGRADARWPVGFPHSLS